MRRTTKSLIAAAALVLGASVHADAQTIRLTAVLSGANETPAPLVTGAAGSADIYVNLADQTVAYEIKVFNIPTPVTAGHFHVSGPGVGGPVVVNLSPPVGVTDDFTLSGKATAANLTARPDQGIKTWADFIQALVGEQVYVNIHTQTNGGGEIRGQLRVERE